MRRVTVEVTAEDIAKGLRNCARHCPIALAAQRACPDIGGLLGVYRRRGKLALDTWHTDGPELPPSALSFVDRFDNRLHVEPFTFEVELP